MTSKETIIEIQKLLGVTADGIFGPKSQAALDGLIWKKTTQEVHKVIASSFADPADIQAFKRCKAQGKSDQECFKVGDNGIGKWGDDTTVDKPMCALPPEDWRPLGVKAQGALVHVVANNCEVICELRDTMPHKANVKNGAGIDLNPAACAALNLKPPVMITAIWRWV